MSASQVVFQLDPPDGPPLEGLRSRKKARTRLAIEDAALELFAAQGYEATSVDEIAERAEVSTTTFFRYFPSKAEVILTDRQQRVPDLQQAIVGRPPHESDLVALHHALRDAWISSVDPERTARTSQVVASSATLRGLSYEIGHGWIEAIAEAVAHRHDQDRPDARCVAAARVAMSVFGSSVEVWVADGCRDDLADVVERGFDITAELCGEWTDERGAPGRA
jgi:AcrR family transcriptional regulator